MPSVHPSQRQHYYLSPRQCKRKPHRYGKYATWDLTSGRAPRPLARSLPAGAQLIPPTPGPGCMHAVKPAPTLLLSRYGATIGTRVRSRRGPGIALGPGRASRRPWTSHADGAGWPNLAATWVLSTQLGGAWRYLRLGSSYPAWTDRAEGASPDIRSASGAGSHPTESRWTPPLAHRRPAEAQERGEPASQSPRGDAIRLQQTVCRRATNTALRSSHITQSPPLQDTVGPSRDGLAIQRRTKTQSSTRV